MSPSAFTAWHPIEQSVQMGVHASFHCSFSIQYKLSANDLGGEGEGLLYSVSHNVF